MNYSTIERLLAFTALACAMFITRTPFAYGAEVTLQVEFDHPSKGKNSQTNAASVVIWLNPLTATTINPQPLSQENHFRLIQHNKEFSPHLLVIPVGSIVDFPNRDPFYHNVFSLFNGKRFDLGLYESGSNRAVHFDHEGISYIFCNIHPEMGAVVIALNTPYFATPSSDGKVVFHNVPAGTYEMKIWSEGSNTNDMNTLSRRIQVDSAQENLGLVHIYTDTHVMKHKNKFGEDYPPAEAPTY